MLQHYLTLYKYGRKLLALSALAVATCQCGAVGSGSGFVNDNEPTGTIVAQGSFSGGDYSGIAKVYLSNSGSNIVRLEGFSAETTSGVFLVALTNSTTALNTQLKGLSGNQNYTTSVTGSATWASVQIEDTLGNTLSAATMINL